MKENGSETYQSKTSRGRDGKGAGLDGKSEGGEGCNGEHFCADSGGGQKGFS
jgi:hypothetical protein